MSYSDPIRKICQNFALKYMKAENYSVRYEQLKNTLSDKVIISVGSDVLTKYFTDSRV